MHNRKNLASHFNLKKIVFHFSFDKVLSKFSLTHLHRVGSSTTTLWISLFQTAGCLVDFYYYYFL